MQVPLYVYVFFSTCTFSSCMFLCLSVQSFKSPFLFVYIKVAACAAFCNHQLYILYTFTCIFSLCLCLLIHIYSAISLMNGAPNVLCNLYVLKVCGFEYILCHSIFCLSNMLYSPFGTVHGHAQASSLPSPFSPISFPAGYDNNSFYVTSRSV